MSVLQPFALGRNLQHSPLSKECSEKCHSTFAHAAQTWQHDHQGLHFVHKVIFHTLLHVHVRSSRQSHGFRLQIYVARNNPCSQGPSTTEKRSELGAVEGSSFILAGILYNAEIRAMLEVFFIMVQQ